MYVKRTAYEDIGQQMARVLKNYSETVYAAKTIFTLLL